MKNQNHWGPTVFGDDHRSRAWWSQDPNSRALFFVHGLGGDSIKTWGGFPKTLLSDHDFSGFDLFFFGYDSRAAQAYSSAMYLISCLDPLMSNTAEIANKFLCDSDKRSETFNYDEIFLIVHSLGAPVARQSQLIAYQKNLEWLNKTRIVCFAPAHLGSTVPEYLDELSGILLSIGIALLKIQCPVLNDLKTGSDFLTHLVSDVTVALNNGYNDPFIARKVIFGQLEKFVPVAPPFLRDPDAEQIVNCGHSNVCKPTPQRMEPYYHLRSSV